MEKLTLLLMNPFFELLVTVYLIDKAFQWKHTIADYPLQTPYMLGKFKAGVEWVLPLTSHCIVHALFTLLILGTSRLIMPLDWWVIWSLTAFDFVCHFIMDRIKASPNLLGRYTTLSKSEMHDIKSRYPNDVTAEDKAKLRSNKLFWWSLGLDQHVHHETHSTIWFLAITSVLAKAVGVL